MNIIEEYNNNEKIAFLIAEFDSKEDRLVYHIKLYNNRRKHRLFRYRDNAERWLKNHDFVRAFN